MFNKDNDPGFFKGGFSINPSADPSKLYNSSSWQNGFGKLTINSTLCASPWEEKLDKVLAEIRSTLVAKHHDYGEDNLKTFGELGVLVRSFDKVSRLKSLVDKDGLVNESKRNTWIDLAGYAVQALILFFS